MKVLVTGGAGFIASHITDALIEAGHEVLIVDNLSTGKREFLNPNAKFVEADIRNENLLNIFQDFRPQVVYHEAAQIDVQTSIKTPMVDVSTNIMGSVNVMECAHKTGVEKVIYASSAAVYGEPSYLGLDENHPVNPMSHYGISKHTPEHYFRIYKELYGLKYTCLRYANVYGIRQDPKGEGGVVSVFVDKMLKKERPSIFGDGSATRDYVYVADIVQANILALTKGDNEIINIGTGVPVSVRELFDVMNEIVGNHIEPIMAPARAGDILHSYYDITKARTVLGFEPKYLLADGLQKTVEYYREKYQK